MKIEKERKFKREYIPVILAGLILILFVSLIVLTVNYEANITDDSTPESEVVDNEDLAIEKTDSKCSTDELKEIIASASKISGTYSKQSKQVPMENADDPEMSPLYFPDGTQTYNYLELLIKGITDDVYVKITNNYNDEVKTIKASDLDESGEFRYEAPTMDEKVEYVINVYSNKYDCVDEVVRKVAFTTNIYNNYSEMLACVMYPNYPNCSIFIPDAITYDQFDKGLTEYQKKNKVDENQVQANLINAFYEQNIVTAEDVKNNELVSQQKGMKKTLRIIKENVDLIIIASVVIGIGVLVVVLLMFIRRNKL